MNYFLPNPKGGLSENSIAFFSLNTLHPSRNNTQEPLKIYEMEVSLIVWAQECFIWFMDSAASLATQAKIVQVVNYRDAWNYRLGGTRSQRFQGKVQDAVKTSQKKTFPLHGKFLDVHISLGCWFVSWNILSRERRRGKGILTLSSKGKPRAQTSISNISSKIISWFTSGGKKADLCCLCREKELNPKWHTLETCSSWSATASVQWSVSCYSSSAREVACSRTWPIILFLPPFLTLSKSHLHQVQAKKPRERQSSFAQLKLCPGALAQPLLRQWFPCTA